MNIRLATICSLFAFYSVTSVLMAQAAPAFDPFPGGLDKAYHFDLSRTLFSSPEAERQQRTEALATAARAAALASSANTSATGLLSMLRTADSAHMRPLGINVQVWGGAAMNPSMGSLAGSLIQRENKVELWQPPQGQ